MSEPLPGQPTTKAERRAARALVVTYHEAKLADLIEHVRGGIAGYDAGELDVFALDDLIHQYKQAARELWKFCVGGGAHVERAARTLEYLREQGELPDWWERGAPRERR